MRDPISILKFIVKRSLLASFRAFPRTSYRILSIIPGQSPFWVIMRGWLMRAQVEKFQQFLSLLHYSNALRVDRDDCFVDTDGIEVNTRLVDRYFLYEGDLPYRGEAARLFEKLQRYPLKYDQFVDLGANSGDFSIWFAKHTAANIVAVEASTENLQLFDINLAKNGVDPARVKIVRKAISNVNGTIEMTVGRSQGNAIIDARGPTETVECTTLGRCLREAGITHIDVLKIDIEGSEPLLLDDLREWLPKTDCVLIEMGSLFNIAEAYDPLVDLFMDNQFICESYTEGKRLDCEEIKRSIRTGTMLGDYLFVKKSLAEPHASAARSDKAKRLSA